MATWDQFNPPLPENVVPTTFSQKYGVSIHDKLFKAGKSGLTPLSPLEPFSSRPYSKAEQLQVVQRHTYQRSHLEGFTAHELEDLGCINVTDAKESTIDGIPLHPLYHRDNWLNSAQDAAVGYTVSGLWQAKNDVIWDMLLPCLKLASVFLSSKTCLPWFDALSCGERRLVTETIPTAWAPLYTFHKRSPQEAQTEIDAGIYQGANYLITSPTITRKIKFSISAILAKGIQAQTGNANASRPSAAFSGHVEITLSTQLFGPLLRTDLNTSERLATQFKAAKTILHETSHALQSLVNEFVTEGMCPSEPFFEDERIAEIGYSMERALFEGNLSILGLQVRKDVTSVPPSITAWGIPVMGLTMNIYPNWSKADTLKRTMLSTNERLTLINRPHRTNFYNLTDFDDDVVTGKEVTYTTWPIPIRYISQFHSLDFWLSTLGTQQDHLRIPRLIGKQKTRTRESIAAGSTFLKYLQFVPETTAIPNPVTAQAEKALNDEEAIKGYTIRMILRNRVDWEQIKNWTRRPTGWAKFVVRAGSLPAGVSISGAGTVLVAGDTIAPGPTGSVGSNLATVGTALNTAMQVIGVHPGPPPQDPTDAAFYQREALPVVVDSAGDVVMGGTSLPASSWLQDPGNYPPTTPNRDGTSRSAVTPDVGKRGTKRGADTSGDEGLRFGGGKQGVVGGYAHSAKKTKGVESVGVAVEGTGPGTRMRLGVDAGVGMNIIRGATRGKGAIRGTAGRRGSSSTRSRGGTRGGRPLPARVGRGGSALLPSTRPLTNETTTLHIPSQISTQATPSGRGRGSLRILRGTHSNRRNPSTSSPTLTPLSSTPLLGRSFSIPRAGLSLPSRRTGNISNRGVSSRRRRGGVLKPPIPNDNGNENANKGVVRNQILE